MNIREDIIEIIASIEEEKSVREVLAVSDDLIQLELNSLSVIKIIVEIENKFNIEFDDELLDQNKFTSLRMLCDYVENCMKVI